MPRTITQPPPPPANYAGPVYVATYDGAQLDAYAAANLWDATEKARAAFQPPKTQRHMVSVHIVANEGRTIIHTATE